LSKRHPTQFKIQLCQDIRNGVIGWHDAQHLDACRDSGRREGWHADAKLRNRLREKSRRFDWTANAKRRGAIYDYDALLGERGLMDDWHKFAKAGLCWTEHEDQGGIHGLIFFSVGGRVS
jgi:hypothetical protein